MVVRLFYEACTAPAWMLSVEQAGHFRFLDKQSSMQRAVCAQGRVPDYSVRQLSQVSTCKRGCLFMLHSAALCSSLLHVGKGQAPAYILPCWQFYTVTACVHMYPYTYMACAQMLFAAGIPLFFPCVPCSSVHFGVNPQQAMTLAKCCQRILSGVCRR